MRTFIQYDENGEIVAVMQAESLPERVEQPFHLEDEKHGVLEVSGDEEVGLRPGSEIGELFKVDVAERKLVEKSAPTPTAKKSKRSPNTK
jgi:hypothetical protein